MARKYSEGASKYVERAMKKRKKGTLKSGRSGRKVKSKKQAIAIGLSEARRAGVKLPPPAKGKVSERTRESAKRAWEVGQGKRAPRAPSAKRSRAIKRALKREGRSAASRTALSKQAHAAARGRTAAERSAAAKKAVRTKGPAERSAAAKKAARTRAAA